MKRIIIWSIVGVLVIAAFIFTLSQRKRNKYNQPPTTTANIISDAEAYEKFTTSAEKEVERSAKRIDQRKEKLTNPTPAQQALLSDLDKKFVEFQSAVTELRGKTSQEEREIAVNKVKDSKKELRNLIRDLGGKTTGESDDK
jgi:hypothetical protein